MLRLATWNVNSVRQRLDIAAAWLKERKPDLVALQEIKCIDDDFPRQVFEDLGYNVAVHGQKTFNGVAVLSRLPFDQVTKGLPGSDEDVQARYLEVTVSTAGGALRFANLYLPNGNPIASEKFSYKIGWMDRLIAHARANLADEIPFVLAGDYNAIPMPEDARDIKAWLGDALYQPETRAKLRALANLGFVDAVRAASERSDIFTFWDYQAGAWQKDFGIRIDHLMLSPQAADRLALVGVDRAMRSREKPSDHVPVYVDLQIEAPAARAA